MKKTITDAFEPYIGTVEYNGVVAEIQEWFYGWLIKDSWCATSVSYFANQVGVLDQIGGKNENVCNMMNAARKTGIGTFYYKEDIPKGYTVKRGTVMFMLWSGEMKPDNPRIHVTTCYEDFAYKGSGYCKCLGGNQSDSIKINQYSQGNIYAIFVPNYEDDPKTHPTLRKGDKGADVKKMQSDLRKIGFARVSGEEMVADGSFGRITAATVLAFQTLTGIKADAVCGKITWGKIDELLAMPKEKTVALTDVYYRIAPGKNFKALGIVKEGTQATYTCIVDGWLYFPSLKGWGRSSYFSL